MSLLYSDNRSKFLVLATGLLLAALTVGPTVAGDEESASGDEVRATTLTDIGLAFDENLLKTPTLRMRALKPLESSIKSLLKQDLDSREEKAARYLSAEIALSLGKYPEAEELFSKSAKDYKKGHFADDAEFLRIIAIESDGRDAEAAKEWDRWLKKYGDGPLASEALITRSWNEIRRDSLRLATNTLGQLGRDFPHTNDDPRVILATATIDYLQGRPGRALAALGEANETAAHLYLAGLCQEADGSALKAAAQYQKVFEQFPESPLRDPAMLAKANVFLASQGYQSAIEEYTRVIDSATDEAIVAEAQVRRAGSRFLAEDGEGATDELREVVRLYPGQQFAARAQLLLGVVLHSRGMYEDAVIEYNKVLTDYFEHELAASAQYRVGRCLDALDRHTEATTAYQLVVSGYPMSPQSPAAAYLAGAGLLEQGRPLEAAPYFQLVLDRYAADQGDGKLVFESPERQELVEAALCLLELSYHRGGDMGQLSGVPHLMLQKMPQSKSTWRAYALLIDADALAAQGRHDEAQEVLQTLIDGFANHEVGLPANRLLAWTYAQQGKDDLAIALEEKMLDRYAGGAHDELSSAYINKAHILFNNKDYKKAAAAYDNFYRQYPSHPDRLLALYQAGLCYSRLQQTGDAVDRWEALVEADSASEISERAWVRAGDLYFQSGYYEDAKRCYQGLLDNFADSKAAALGMLRMAQCDFNAGQDQAALKMYSEVMARFPGTGIAREAEKGMEVALYRLGQSEDGGQVLTELVEQYPTSAFAADAQFEIAMRLYDDGEYQAAAEEFRRVVSQFPSYSAADRAHFLMAESFQQAGQAAEARNGYEQFLMFFPESEFQQTVRFKLGTIRFVEGDYMQAAVDFSTVLEQEIPEETRRASLFNLALCKKMIGDIEGARESLTSYIKEFPTDGQIADATYQLGDILESSGEYEAAAAQYEKSLAAGASAALKVELHYRLGLCQEELENVDSAIGFYEKAANSRLKSDTYRLTALVRCAALYEQKGQYKKAISAYRDLVNNAEDSELVAAAQERVAHLESVNE